MNMAVIFDMDGVIIDNIPYHKQASREICRRYGRELTDEDFDLRLSGRKNDAVLAFLLNRAVTEAEAQAYELEKEALYRGLVRPCLQPTRGLMPLLEQLRARDIPCAIATGAPIANVDFVLDGMKIRHYFGAIVDAGQVKHGKPDPEVYLTAALRLKAGSQTVCGLRRCAPRDSLGQSRPHAGCWDNDHSTRRKPARGRQDYAGLFRDYGCANSSAHFLMYRNFHPVRFWRTATTPPRCRDRSAERQRYGLGRLISIAL